MSTAFTTTEFPLSAEIDPVGVPLPLDALHEPGTYVCNWSGNLLRIRDTDPSRFSIASLSSQQQWTVTRISPDPELSRFEARMLADDLGLRTSF